MAEKNLTIVEANNPFDFLCGGGEMGTLIRSMDWSQTLLGPPISWPQSLKTAASICLSSRYPMFIAWGEHRSMLYNDSYTSVLAGKHPWALGRPAQEVWAEIWHILGPHWLHVFNKGEGTWAEDLLLIMNRSGYDEETYFTFSYSPIRGEGGRVEGMFCACQETTEKVVGERRLKTLRELASQAATARSPEAAVKMSMKTLSGNSADVPFALFYLLGEDGRYAFRTGISGFDAKPNAGPSRIDVDEEDLHGWPLGQALREGTARVIENLWVRLGSLPSGPWGHPTTRALLLPIQFAAHERPSGVLVAGISPVRPLDDSYRTFFEVAAGQIASAISNARAYHEERRRAEALAEIDRAKTTFFSDVSHEFRTPLTLMLGPVEDLLATSHVGLSPAAKGQLEVVNRNGLRLLRLVNTLLDFSRLEAGRMQAVYEPTDLAAFTIELVGVFRAATERAGLHLTVDCPRLPEPVYVDRDMWEKVVLNLLSNAFKFTLEGEIEVSLRESDGSAELRVRDTGVGIPAEEMPRIFERFHRVQNMRSRTHEGSGIGLALVQELIQLHGGTVRAESRLNEGTTFIVRVPLGKDHLPQDRIGATRDMASTAVGAAPFVEEALRWLPEQPAMQEAIETIPRNELLPVPSPQEPDEKRPWVIVTDDNADMRQYLVRILSERYNVKPFPDGQAALSAAREHRPDLILSDVMMPGLDGFGLLREIRADEVLKTVPVILLSARAGEESRVEGLQQGADDYLIKPFSARELLARVDAHLKMARIRKEAEEALKANEQRLHAFLEQLPVGIAYTDLQGEVQISNSIFRRFVPQRIPSRDPDRVKRWRSWTPDGKPVEPSNWPAARALRGESVTPGMELLYTDFDGREIWTRVSSVPFHSVTGEIVGTISVIQDIDSLKRAADILRSSEVRKSFLLKLTDALRPLADPVEIQETAARVLGEHLGADRVAYFEVWDENYVVQRDYTASVPHVLGRFSIASFGPRLLNMYCRGETSVGCDTQSDDSLTQKERDAFAAIQIKAYIGVPLVKQGHFVAGLAVHMNEPRSWTPDEVSLAEETAELTWAAVERARAETALRESENRLRALFNSTEEAIITLDGEMRCLEANPAAGVFTGMPPELLVGRSLQEFVDDRYDLAGAWATFLRMGRFKVEIPIRHVDGTYHHVEATGFSEITPGRHLFVGRDVTERERAEEALRESDFRFRLALRNAPVSVAAQDRDLRYIWAYNQRTARPEEIIGHRDSEIFTPEEAAHLDKIKRRVLEEGVEIREQIWLNRPTCRIFLDGCWEPIRDQEGRTVGVASATIDLTPLKVTEEALRQSELRYRLLSEDLEVRVRERTAELERKNRELQEFAFVASHDLNEPLRKIQTFGSLLEARSADRLDQQQRDYISRITGSANRMQELLSALLNYSRIEARGESFKPTPLHNVVRDAISDMEVEIRAAGAQLSVGSLPTIMGDPNQLRQLFQNLIGNAIKYRRLEVSPTVDIRRAENNGQCRILVEDNGIGFEEKYLEKIFQPFQRLHGKHEYTGTGIGLAICRKVVERHGGTITAKSTPGQGSTFIITLPVNGAK